MSIPLLRTKFYIPPAQPGLVHRPRLINLINEGLTRKLTLISAPAGFGKTTVLHQWILLGKPRVTWLSLEEADNDPIRFWTYFMAALQILQENLCQDAAAFLQGEGQQSMLSQPESFLTILLNEISAYPNDFSLVLDDYQRINNKAVQEGLIFLIDHLPPRMHLIFTCRADPPLPLARLRARGQMIELRSEDLRFTTDEVVAFLNQIMRLNLPMDQIASLEARTEGWIAGLQLAAISMQRRVDTLGFIESFTGSHRFILDYLVDEVLNCQPDEVQAFLLETSILERFTAALCNLVTGSSNGQEMLEEFEQDNLFIIPLDNERRWYRYHHLFADLLRSRLKESRPDRIKILHQRACDWFEQEGLLPEAVNHALTASEYERAAQLMERAAETQRQLGEIVTLTGWMNALPSTIRLSRPALCLAYARALIDAAQMKAVETLIEEAQSGLEMVPVSTASETASLKGQIAALRAYLAMVRHQYEETIEYSRQARELLGGDEARWRNFVAITLAGAYRFTNDWAAASQTYLEASDLSQTVGDMVNALMALSLRGEVLQAQGHLHQSARQYEQVLNLAQEYAIPNAPVTGYALVGLGRAWCEWNDLDAAARFVQAGLQFGKKGDILDLILRGYLALARIRQAQQDFEGALAALESALAPAAQMGVAEIKDWINAFRVQVWLARGETGAAVEWASTYAGELSDSIYPSIPIVLAKIRLVQGTPEVALGLLEHALQAAHAVGRMGNAIQILVVKALAQQAQGERENAFITLSKALTLAAPEGYIRVFLDEGEPMRLLLSDLRSDLRSVLTSNIDNGWRGSVSNIPNAISDYINIILAAFPGLSPALPHSSNIDQLPSSIAEPLSDRELEILRLIAAGLSNRDIADRDVVSINTVKTQVKSIFGKLGVHHRQDAISVGKSFHLL